MKKLLFILLFVFLNVFFACNREETLGPVDPYFRIKSIYALNQSRSGSPSSVKRVLPTDTVDVSNYFVTIGFGKDYYSQSTPRNNHNGMLYALEPMPSGYKGAKEGIRRLDVITLKDYNPMYKANDTFSNALEYGYFNQSSFEDYVSNPEFIKLHENSIPDESFTFRIISPVGYYIQTAQFKIILELTNGDVFETTTDPVLIRSK